MKRLTGLFQEWGLTPGDRLLIGCGDDGAVVTVVLACLACGLSAVIVDHSATAREADSLIEHVQPDAAVIDESLQTVLAARQVAEDTSPSLPESGIRERYFARFSGKSKRRLKSNQYPIRRLSNLMSPPHRPMVCPMRLKHMFSLLLVLHQSRRGSAYRGKACWFIPKPFQNSGDTLRKVASLISCL